MNDKLTFEDVLSRFGPHVDRWPTEVRQVFEPMLADDTQVRRLMREAEALDAVLAQAPQLVPERLSRLSSSILAAARQTKQAAVLTPDGVAAAADSNVVSLDARRRVEAERISAQARPIATQPAQPTLGGLRGRRMSASSWPAAGVLAASLVLGVWLGSSDVTSSFTGDVVVAFAGATEADEEVSDFPLFDLESGLEVSL